MNYITELYELWFTLELKTQFVSITIPTVVIGVATILWMTENEW